MTFTSRSSQCRRQGVSTTKKGMMMDQTAELLLPSHEQSWESHLAFLGLSFFLCKMGALLVPVS